MSFSYMKDVRARWWAAAMSAGSAARANYVYETKRDQQIRKETCIYEKRREGSLRSGDVRGIWSTRELHTWKIMPQTSPLLISEHSHLSYMKKTSSKESLKSGLETSLLKKRIRALTSFLKVLKKRIRALTFLFILQWRRRRWTQVFFRGFFCNVSLEISFSGLFF